MGKFKITTLGCKVNQSESEAIAQQLQGSNWIPVRTEAGADLCIVNTCTVTQKASMQSRQAVRQAIRNNPGAKILVTGCYAQIAPDEIKKIKGVQEVISHSSKHKIPEMIINGKAPYLFSTEYTQKENLFKTMPLVGFGQRTRPFVKIQDGCDAFCTFCIVPHARGPSRSLPLNHVLDNIRHLKKQGYLEIVLTGIHLGCYGWDLSPKTSLLELLKCIHIAKTIDRVRLSSVEPRELTEDIVNFVAQSGPGPGQVCHHFHIPLQSGDDQILKRMNRPYTRELFRDLIWRIHELLPEAAIGVDTLIGFPGESETAFENTYAFIEELPISYLHVFPFSPRKGTPAYAFPDQIHTNIIKTRCQKMRALGSIKKKMFYKRFVGKTLDVLVEDKIDKKTGLIWGKTSNYIPVLIRGDGIRANTIVQTRITALNGDNSVSGTICNIAKFGSS
jgi:threonylcarbamoyladenosine tRNA methylthiotransferase MtaB